jgi:hypothetical protein
MKEIKINLELPLWQLTAGQLLDIVAYGIQAKNSIEDPTVKTTDERRFVYGLAGIAKLFGTRSKTTANRIKQSGVIDDAIYQFGNKIIVDADKALELVKASRKRKKPYKK